MFNIRIRSPNSNILTSNVKISADPATINHLPPFLPKIPDKIRLLPLRPIEPFSI